MSVNDSLERQLIETELQLLAMLERTLPVCSKDGTLLFFNSENLPDNYQVHWLPSESNELRALANRSVAFRAQLGMETIGTLGQLFLSVCAENADGENPHRRGPRKLATWLLSKIQALKHSAS